MGGDIPPNEAEALLGKGLDGGAEAVHVDLPGTMNDDEDYEDDSDDDCWRKIALHGR